MRPRTALALALALMAGALGCGARQTSGRSRAWTMFDLLDAAIADRHVAAGGSLPEGLRAANFVHQAVDASGAPIDEYDLSVSHGFLDGLPMTLATTEIWQNVDEIWVQPLYRAIDENGAIVDDPDVIEPWVFGVGPKSLFYSPYWQVFGFQVPPGMAVTSIKDTRAVLEAANQTGGLRWMDRRITSLVPGNVEPPQEFVENSYYDDAAAWDGVGGRRYLDLGPGRFDTDADSVVREVPIFMFAGRNAAGQLEPRADLSTVGGTHPLFSTPPSLSGGMLGGGGGGMGGASGATTVGTLAVEPSFGGLWRIHLVEVPPDAAAMSDGRVVLHQSCLTGASSRPCVVIDSQTAIEALGAAAISRTELLVSCPLLALGDRTFPTVPQTPPRPQPP